MPRWLRLSVFAMGLVCGAACDDPRRGGAGESCGSANDCRPGLACLALVCVPAADGGTTTSGLGPGASCGARRDCAVGLSCITNVCKTQPMSTEPSSSRFSGAGESCQAKNDCAADLSCLMGVCRVVNLSLGRTAKSCYRVECATKEDCCASFVPNANCDVYQKNCETDPIFCNTYRSLCECSQDCMNELCVAAAPGCMSAGECTSQQTPYCVAGKCRQCDTDSACTGSGTQCVEGVCMAACTIDENCPLLHACKSGACVETGCTSDRECAFLTKNTLAVCHDAKCQVPCDVDSDCMGDKTTKGFETCEQGQCVFVGCDSDAECRALLGLENQSGNAHAVCR
jgi:hypothetical protein